MEASESKQLARAGSVVVEKLGELAPRAVASWDYFDDAVAVVAAEDGIGDARQLTRLDGQVGTAPAFVVAQGVHDARVAEPLIPVDAYQGAPLDVVTHRHPNSITDWDTETRLGLEQAVLADADADEVATGEGSHDGGAAADIGASSYHYSCTDAPLDHARPECASVEVDETLLHDRGAVCQVGAKPNTCSVSDPHATRTYVVDHLWELVHTVDGELLTLGIRVELTHIDVIWPHRALVGPSDVGQDVVDAIQVDSMRLHLAVRQQVESQVGILDGDGWLCLVVADEAHHDALVGPQVATDVPQPIEQYEVRVVTTISLEHSQRPPHIADLFGVQLCADHAVVVAHLVGEECGDAEVLIAVDEREPGVEVAHRVAVGDADRVDGWLLVVGITFDLSDECSTVFGAANTES